MPDSAVTKPPVARRPPASAKSEQRIRDILRVGREVLSEHGYERATTIEIAQRLAISEATVFTYFRGKRELCMRVIGDWYDEIIGVIETGMPHDQPIRVQFEFFIRTHLRLFLIHGTGMCALVLSEGRSKGPGLGDSLLPLQRRYTAPLMAMLARGQAGGELRTDLPLRLLRPLVLGPIEHLLWEVVAQDRSSDHQIDVDALSRSVVPMLWSAIEAPDRELMALRGLRDEVVVALKKVDGY